jgi:hypothetical protein
MKFSEIKKDLIKINIFEKQVSYLYNKSYKIN